MNDGYANSFHHAFRTRYPAKVSALITDCKIAIPSAISTESNKEFHAFKCLWDTGATNSVITKKVIRKLSLQSTGKINTKGVHGEKIANTYIIDIVLPNRVCFQNVKVSEGEIIDNIDVIIGMDIIQSGDFAIANADNKTTFSYCTPPHKNPIDLLEKSERVNERVRKKMKRYGYRSV